jgi:hypothetical protein
LLVLNGLSVGGDTKIEGNTLRVLGCGWHTGMIPNEQDSFQGHNIVNQFLPKEKI